MNRGGLIGGLAVLALGGLLLLDGLDVLTLTFGIAGAAVLAVCGVALLISGLSQDSRSPTRPGGSGGA